MSFAFHGCVISYVAMTDRTGSPATSATSGETAQVADPGIVRNRLKIASAIRNARSILDIRKEFGSFDAYLWRFVQGRPRTNRWKSLRQIPASTGESDALSAELKTRGFSFVGSTICYAFMQAAGMVNDHLVSCFRYAEVSRLP